MDSVLYKDLCGKNTLHCLKLKDKWEVTDIKKLEAWDNRQQTKIVIKKLIFAFFC